MHSEGKFGNRCRHIFNGGCKDARGLAEMKLIDGVEQNCIKESTELTFSIARVVTF